jgi:mono/diheme cytochrome c family protein
MRPSARLRERRSLRAGEANRGGTDAALPRRDVHKLADKLEQEAAVERERARRYLEAEDAWALEMIAIAGMSPDPASEHRWSACPIMVMLAVNLISGGTLIRIARERELNGKPRRGRNDMPTKWCMIFAAWSIIATINVLHAQPAENPGRSEFLRSCASCHGVSGKGDGPVAKSLKLRPTDLTRLSEANNGVFPVSRVHEVIDGRIERLVHGTRDMPVWGERYMREMISPESPGFVSKEWAEAMVRRRISALVEYISTLQRPTRRSR